jgi:hypothetical protein
VAVEQLGSIEKPRETLTVDAVAAQPHAPTIDVARDPSHLTARATDL